MDIFGSGPDPRVVIYNIASTKDAHDAWNCLLEAMEGLSWREQLKLCDKVWEKQ